ncbi:hypothetical protein V9K24_000665 [Vibrio cholerae]|nr:hypothetical protein [Vibrio cholerae]EJH62791.1 hypothetical protein VCHE25_2977 [Vibrio cholerae HE-25]EMQ65479.1 hypothetical protein VCNHCC008D_002439 [Vibrio cholerae O1 str. NHCC-008D]EGR0543809.1 hypothetical protein [Vibrio cholerae]EGR0568356.1 hypothetical protein [Vibrio cholerae]
MKNLPNSEFVAHTFSLYFEQDFLVCAVLNHRHILRQLVSIKAGSSLKVNQLQTIVKKSDAFF